jgi:retron-type reverse transcriptase
MRLVKQIQVVTINNILVKNIRSQNLYERLFSELYKRILRYDPLNKMWKYYTTVPLCRKNLLRKIKILNQEADHVRTYNLSFRQRMQSKCVLNKSSNNKVILLVNSFLKRCYSCQVCNSFIKIDVNINNKMLSTVSRQDVRDKIMESQRDLDLFKKEILCESKYLTPLLIKSIKNGIWPMLKFNKEIETLVKKRQKYLSMLSNQYGFRSTIVVLQVEEWLTKLDLRVFAIETVYKFSGNFIPELDNLKLKRENLFSYLETMKYGNLKHYKADSIRNIYISKSKKEKQLLEISIIKDLIVQTLFVQIIEPIIDVYADNHSFGFRKGRNHYQVIGLLSKLLDLKPRKQKNLSDKQHFICNKYIFNIAIEKFFNKVNCDWLLKNYPFPNNFIFILQEWLLNEVVYQSEYEISTTKFVQSSIIGPSFVNFILNGLEKIIISGKVINYDKSKNMHYNKTFTSFFVRYADHFIVVVNDKEQVKIISDKIDYFFKERGLNKNFSKSKIVKWENNSKLDYLGFIFHYIIEKKISRIMIQNRFNKNFTQSGLYVYPSKIKVQIFKNKIKEIIKNNLNVSPYYLIYILNPIIKSWGNYFGIGTLRIFFRLDYFIWYRIWRYLRRKYKKVSTKSLINRHFKKIKTSFGRSWQFYGTFKCVKKNTTKRKVNVIWLSLLCELNNPVAAYMFCPSENLIKSIYYIDEIIFNKYNLKILKLCSKKKSVSK